MFFKVMIASRFSNGIWKGLLLKYMPGIAFYLFIIFFSLKTTASVVKSAVIYPCEDILPCNERPNNEKDELCKTNNYPLIVYRDGISFNYQFMSHSGKGVSCSQNDSFYVTPYFITGTVSSVNIKEFIKTVPKEFKNIYNWNINKGHDCTGERMYASDKKVRFRSAKSNESWIRAIVFEDGSMQDVAASSEHFRVKTNDGSLVFMKRVKADGSEGSDESYSLAATVDFTTAKKYEIRFGSVNSGSIQSSLVGKDNSYPLTVPANCTKGKIIYSFKTNRVKLIVLEEEELLSQYQFMNHHKNDVRCTGSQGFEDVEYYASGSGFKVNTLMFIKKVSANFKSTYYWNINKGASCDGANLFATNRSIVFKSSKASESWIRTIIFSEQNVGVVAASSTHFRVKRNDGLLFLMKPSKLDGTEGFDESYSVSADIDFEANKRFEIRSGSVNSGSVQASLVGENDSYPVEVPEDWKKVRVIYSFRTNKITLVKITEAKLISLSAVPSICEEGSVVTVKAEVDEIHKYNLSFTSSFNHGSYALKPHIVNNNQAEFSFVAQAGIHHIKLSATDIATGQTTVFEDICVKSLNNTGGDKFITSNPYKNIDWQKDGQYKGNFHLHTNWSSDCSMPAHEVVDLYHSKGYKILPLTNHNFSSYPWDAFNSFKSEWQNRNAEAIGMLTFAGNELSGNNHHNDFFTGRNDNGADLEASFSRTQRLGGMQIINHPGQYWKIDKRYSGLQKNSPMWHANNFKRYESLVGIEVYNQGNKHPNDRVLWDEILTITMPERPVWGYSNDDAHHVNQAFFNYSYMLMSEFSIDKLKESMNNGQFYFSYEYNASGNALAPYISSITIDQSTKTINIQTIEDRVYWISGVENSREKRKSAIVGYGKSFNYTGFKGNYVRALIKNKYGETCIQPIGFGETNTKSASATTLNITEKLHVYPNPTNGKITIESNEPCIGYVIYNSAGDVIISKKNISKTILKENISGFSGGVYLVCIQLKNKLVTKKIVLAD